MSQGIKAGSEVQFKELPPITLDQLHRFSEASGDPNEIHLKEEVAKKMGLPGVIAHGMLIASFLSERALDFLEESSLQGWTLKGFKTRFKAMTFLGDVISAGGKVKEAADGVIKLDLQAKKQNGETVCVAMATLVQK